MQGLALLVQEGLGRDPFKGDVFVFRGRGRVAMPFGFALTDPGGRISRTRLFPRVTRVISEPAPKFE